MSDTRASFTSLPPEIRAQIYKQLFNSTTLSFPAPPVDSEDPPPSSHTNARQLGILLASKAINAEAEPLWRSRCLFQFDTTQRMLDVLTKRPQPTLSSIRHVLVTKALPICVLISVRQFVSYSFVEALAFLPGLQLDRLLLGDPWHDTATRNEDTWKEFGTERGFDRKTYKFIERLVRSSNGWKELYVYMPTLATFSWESGPVDEVHGDLLQRFEQPEEWTETLEKRDGKGHGAKASLHFARQMGDEIPSWLAQRQGISGEEECWLPDGEQPMANLAKRASGEQNESKRGEYAKENSVVVVLQRGQGVTYTQEAKPDEKLQEQMVGLDWSEAKRQGLLWDPRKDLTAC